MLPACDEVVAHGVVRDEGLQAFGGGDLFRRAGPQEQRVEREQARGDLVSGAQAIDVVFAAMQRQPARAEEAAFGEQAVVVFALRDAGGIAAVGGRFMAEGVGVDLAQRRRLGGGVTIAHRHRPDEETTIGQQQAVEREHEAVEACDERHQRRERGRIGGHRMRQRDADGGAGARDALQGVCTGFVAARRLRDVAAEALQVAGEVWMPQVQADGAFAGVVFEPARLAEQAAIGTAVREDGLERECVEREVERAGFDGHAGSCGSVAAAP